MKIKYLIFLLLSSLLMNCASQKTYYWGDYSNTLYAYRKDATEQNLLKHQQTLETIIAESQKQNLRVPPGVYAELGFIYFKQGKNDLAIKYFEMESQLYPESQVLMTRLIQAASAKSDEPAAAKATPGTDAGKPDKQESIEPVSVQSEKTDAK